MIILKGAWPTYVTFQKKHAFFGNWHLGCIVLRAQVELESAPWYEIKYFEGVLSIALLFMVFQALQIPQSIPKTEILVDHYNTWASLL